MSDFHTYIYLFLNHFVCWLQPDFIWVFRNEGDYLHHNYGPAL